MDILGWKSGGKVSKRLLGGVNAGALVKNPNLFDPSTNEKTITNKIQNAKSIVKTLKKNYSIFSWIFFDNLEINSKNFEHDVNTCLENKTKRFFKLDWNVEIKTGPIHLLP